LFFLGFFFVVVAVVVVGFFVVVFFPSHTPVFWLPGTQTVADRSQNPEYFVVPDAPIPAAVLISSSTWGRCPWTLHAWGKIKT